MRQGTWLLELHVGGQLLRYATREVMVTDRRGQTHLYRAGLSDFELRLDGMEEEQGIEVTDRELNWAQLVARGLRIDRGQARLRYWVPGQVLEQARTAIDGVIEGPEYGAPGKLSTLVASVVVPSSALLYPTQQQKVDTTTFPYATGVQVFDEALVGASYPIVFGFPGDNETVRTVIGTSAGIPATPALLVKWVGASGPGASHLLLCLGQAHAVGASVRVWDADETQSVGLVPVYATEVEPVFSATDQLGQAYTMCEFVGGSDVDPETGRRYYAAWASTGGFGGGLLRPDGGGPIRSLVDVAAFALRMSGRKVDLKSQETQRGELGPYKVDGCVNEPIEWLPWFEAHLAPLFPIVRVTGPDGIWYRHVNWGARVTSAIAHLSADSGDVRRASGLLTNTAAVANVFSLEYARNAITGAYFGRRTLAPKSGELPQIVVDPFTGTPDLSDDRVLGSPLCARSEALYGPIERPATRSAFVWSDVVASSILAHWALRDALPHRTVTYEGPELARFQRGDIVTITDSEIGLSRTVALVSAVMLSGRRLQRLELEILDPAIRGIA